jgi:hypothetical protein
MGEGFRNSREYPSPILRGPRSEMPSPCKGRGHLRLGSHRHVGPRNSRLRSNHFNRDTAAHSVSHLKLTPLGAISVAHCALLARSTNLAAGMSPSSASRLRRSAPSPRGAGRRKAASLRAIVHHLAIPPCANAGRKAAASLGLRTGAAQCASLIAPYLLAIVNRPTCFDPHRHVASIRTGTVSAT